MREIGRWCEDVAATDTGKVSLSNMMFDIRNRKLDPTTLRDFLQDVKVNWSSTADDRPPETIIRDVVKKRPAKYLGQALRPIPGAPGCSTVISAQVFHRHHLRLRRLGWNNCGEYVPEARLRKLEKTLAGIVKGTLPRNGGIAWVTKTSQIDAFRMTVANQNLASEVRSHLGLAHHYEQMQLIELRY